MAKSETNKPSVTTLETFSPEGWTLAKTSSELVRQVVLGLQANLRHANANTKKRGEVSGGGRKPWRQKGTGRARTGSSRNPIWRGGGITFGPTSIRNYHFDLTVRARRSALIGALARKIAAGAVKSLALDPIPAKTNDLVKAVPELMGAKNFLVIVDSIASKRAFANLPGVTVKLANQINALDLSSARSIILVGTAAQSLKERVKA